MHRSRIVRLLDVDGFLINVSLVGGSLVLNMCPVASFMRESRPVLLLLEGLLFSATLLLALPLLLLVVNILLVVAFYGRVGGHDVTLVKGSVNSMSMCTTMRMSGPHLVLVLLFPCLVGKSILHLGGLMLNNLVVSVTDMAHGLAFGAQVCLVLIPVSLRISLAINICVLVILFRGRLVLLSTLRRLAVKPELSVIRRFLAASVVTANVVVMLVLVLLGRSWCRRSLFSVLLCFGRLCLWLGLILARVLLLGSLLIIRLHLEDEIASLHRHVLGVKDRRVGVEATLSLVPTMLVEGVEIVAPVQLKLVRQVVVRIHLDEVVEQVPGHIRGVQTLSPRVESRGPEVHPHRLLPLHIEDSGVVSRHVTHLVTIDAPADVVGSPLHGVCVPLVFRVEAVRVLMRLVLLDSVTVDDIH